MTEVIQAGPTSVTVEVFRVSPCGFREFRGCFSAPQTRTRTRWARLSTWPARGTSVFPS